MSLLLAEIRNSVLTLDTASATTVTNLFTAGENGSIIQYISVSSTDTADRDMAIHMTISATNYLMGTVRIPLTAGFVFNVPTISLLDETNFPNLKHNTASNSILYLAAGSSLRVGMLAAITAAKQIQIVVQGHDY